MDGDGNSVTTVCDGTFGINSCAGFCDDDFKAVDTDKFIDSRRLTTDEGAAEKSNWSGFDGIGVFEGGRLSFNRDPRRPEAKVGNATPSTIKLKIENTCSW